MNLRDCKYVRIGHSHLIGDYISKYLVDKYGHLSTDNMTINDIENFAKPIIERLTDNSGKIDDIISENNCWIIKWSTKVMDIIVNFTTYINEVKNE